MIKATSVLRRHHVRLLRGLVGRACPYLSLAACLFLTGCASTTGSALSNYVPSWMQGKKQESGDRMLFRGGSETANDGAKVVSKEQQKSLHEELLLARQLYQDRRFDEAEKHYAKVAATNDKIPIVGLERPAWLGGKAERASSDAREEAIFYLAECQREQKKFRTASESYFKLFAQFSNSQFTERADLGLFEIANYWLEDTRKAMAEVQEQREGKRWMVMPASFVNLSQDKPFTDTEGHALRLLERIRLNEINTPLAEKSLFYIANVKFFREDYRDADFYYSQLYNNYPNSQYAPKAVKQAIICKQLVTGGSEYDCRSVEESNRLIHVAQTAYPELAKDDKWLSNQLVSINMQQADRDYKIAEFYDRTGHPGSAYFYFELVRRCYPGTEYGRRATERMEELRIRLEEQKRNGTTGNAWTDWIPQMFRPGSASPPAQRTTQSLTQGGSPAASSVTTRETVPPGTVPLGNGAAPPRNLPALMAPGIN